MSFLVTLLTSTPYILFPQSLVGRLVGIVWWLALAAFSISLLRRSSQYNRPVQDQKKAVLGGLLFAVPLTSLFFGLHFPSDTILVTGQVISWMLLSALPWVLAAGILGPLSAAGLAAFSGLLLALWNTHNAFTIVEFPLFAIGFSLAVQQRYRTSFFQYLRHPFVSALLLALFYPYIDLLNLVILVDANLTTRIEMGLLGVGQSAIASGGALLIAALISEGVARLFPSMWGQRDGIQLSPAERSLQTRFFFRAGPLAAIIFVMVIAGTWVLTKNAYRSLIRERMSNIAGLAAEFVPHYLETGGNLINRIAADPRLRESDAETLPIILAEDMRSFPFFRRLILLDKTGNLTAKYPALEYDPAIAPPDEQVGIQLALNGVPSQAYSIPADLPTQTAQLSFITLVSDESGEMQGVLIGRADLEGHPLLQPLWSAFEGLEEEGGKAILLDEHGRIVFHTASDAAFTSYTSPISDAAGFFEEVEPSMTRQYVYYQPVAGQPWVVILTMPALRAPPFVLGVIIPMLVIILLLSGAAVIVFRFGLQSATHSLEDLAVHAGNLAQGHFDATLPTERNDEVGRLNRAFEQMRLSLKAQMEELNRLLLVSQGVASSLELDEAVRPVLQAALDMGACVARVVISSTVLPELGGNGQAPIRFGLGASGEAFSSFDEQILALTRQQDKLVLNNPTRPRLLTFDPGAPRPQALLAAALRHENQYYGSFWVAYDQPHIFSDSEVRFYVALANQAAIATANARLYLNADIGRQRLAAILASTPDPVLVTDQQNRLLLANPAAMRAFGIGAEWDEGLPVDQVVAQEDLLGLLKSNQEEKSSIEVALKDGKVYSATASSVVTDGQLVGRVCLLRDITSFKNLDSLKTDFVATVSHDLRSPLTLMRGYATMLELVGELNEQQSSYVKKIIDGVERMNHLVSNLLDLGRIEAGIGLDLAMIPIYEVVEKTVGALQVQATQKRVKVKIEAPHQTIPLLEADQELLLRALYNLLDNAIQFTDSGGQVVISLEASPDRMLIKVRDTGMGIAPVDLPHVFEKFYRGAQQLGKTHRGTGLGLAIVKSIAERHGGRVWVESQLGKGSTFFLSFPLRQLKGGSASEKTEK